jgi:two-component system, NarL family, sensor histidine kinase DegS
MSQKLPMSNDPVSEKPVDFEKDSLSVDELIEFIGIQFDEIKQQSKEIRSLIDQSRSEVEKMKQRQGTEAMRLKQIQSSFDSVPREDIRRAYESTMDAQQRLFSGSGQLEKLQAQLGVLDPFSKFLEKVHDSLRLSQPEVKSGPAPKSVVIRIVEAQENERLRLSRLMHDGPAQVLSNFILQVEIAGRLFEIDPVRAKEELTMLKASANSAFQRIRNFIFDLRPMMLDDLGLVPTIRRYLDASKEQGQQEITFTFTGTERRMPNHIEVVLFRAIQQLVALARDPGQASKIKVTLDIDETSAKAVLEHDGKLLDEKGSGQEDPNNLAPLRERVEMLGGTFEYTTQAGQGTYALVQLPTGE